MLEVKNVYKNYKRSGNGRRKEKLNVLQDVSFQIHAGECVGLVGESGSGKSTLGRLILGLEKADAGSIRMEDKEITTWIKENKGQMSVVFQDYTSSANPYYKVSDVISELLRAFGTTGDIQEQVESLLQKVGLPLSVANKYPHELSGGELQRVCIARAISRNPRFLVLDEAISSLDVSTQSQIMELLYRLKENDNMSILFIAHDLQAVSHLCDRVLFMENGQIVEQIATKSLSAVQNDYAKRLLDSVISFHV
ncbi:ABC transporter ATP-binding protein [Paenibacillus sp. An7]|uniref:ABC transporter ATP-binding protein n=1 Tax=Paenibacillus sp. An7 TaxID=2689577 RepID=UPI001359B4EB|nr:ABC transporter ATP-binding protein [Paenibacillus sp. An7]